MADDILGTDALRRQVGMARAVAGANALFPPAPPAETSQTPWQPPQLNMLPNQQPIPKELLQAAPQGQPAPHGRPGLKPKPGRDPATLSADKQEMAWALARKHLSRYADEMAQNINKADLHLAQALMRDGVLLLRNGVPMDAVGALVRLGRDFARNTDTEQQEPQDLPDLRIALERREDSLPPPSQIEQMYREDNTDEDL
jgi:hypothetical protein